MQKASTIRSQFAKMLAEYLPNKQTQLLSSLKVGTYSTVWQGKYDGKACVYKWYHSDARRRFEHARQFHQYLAAAPREVLLPELIDCVEVQHLLVLSFCSGKPVTPAFCAKHLQADTLCQAYQALQPQPLEQSFIPEASDSAWSWQGHVDHVWDRLARMRASVRQLQAENLCQPFLMAVEKSLEQQTSLPWQPDAPWCPRRARWVSPSDVGCHNVMINKDKKIILLDFEHAGWDDPAKLLSDAFLNPTHAFPRTWFTTWLAFWKSQNDPQLAERVQAMHGLTAIKWALLHCQSCLNSHAQDKERCRAAMQHMAQYLLSNQVPIQYS